MNSTYLPKPLGRAFLSLFLSLLVSTEIASCQSVTQPSASHSKVTSLTLDRAKKIFDAPSSLSATANFRPSAPQDLTLPERGRKDQPEGRNDTAEDKEYFLVAVDNTSTREEVLARLRSLQAAGLFGCRNGIDMIMEHYEAWCFFVTRAALPATPAIPAAWSKVIGNDLPLFAWLLAGYRVDNIGRPLEPVNQLNLPLVPLAVETEKRFFLIQERSPEIIFAADTSVRLPGVRVFELRGIPITERFIDRTMNEFVKNLDDSFKVDPIAATPVLDQVIPPHEEWYQRAFKPSKVLGPPYYELSTYLVKWYIGHWRPLTHPVGGVYIGDDLISEVIPSLDPNFRPQRSAGPPYIWVHVVQTITRAVGIKGTYEEPTTEESAKFSEPVQKAFRQALKISCGNMHGSMENGLCVLTRKEESNVSE